MMAELIADGPLDHRWPSLTAVRKSEELGNNRRPSADV
jgi:hypothetical protein